MPHGSAKLVNMKIDPKDHAAEQMAEPAKMDRPVYPWGLQVTLDNDSLEKLGLKSLPKVGSSLYLGANVEVTSVSEDERELDGKRHVHRHVTLQITDMGLGEPIDEEVDAGAALYKG